MYTIVNIIYGVPLNSNKYPIVKMPVIVENAIDDELPGFLAYYNGGGECVPSAFGIELGKFDCCCHHTELSSLTLQPTVKQRKLFKKMLKDTTKISEKLYKALLTFGEPQVFFLWSSS